MAGDTVLVDPGNDDPAATPGGPAPHQAHDGARRLRSRTITTGSNRKVGSKTTAAESPRFLGAAPRVLRPILGGLRQTDDLFVCRRRALQLADPERIVHFGRGHRLAAGATSAISSR